VTFLCCARVHNVQVDVGYFTWADRAGSLADKLRPFRNLERLSSRKSCDVPDALLPVNIAVES
jgi:hypothetical protein